MQTNNHNAFNIVGIFLLFSGVGFSQELASGIDFIGVGYDLLKGNPDGGDTQLGGVDPGIHMSYKIYEMTFDEKKMVKGKKIPDEVVYVPRQSCSKSTVNEMVYGTKSYQKKLSVDVKASVDWGVPGLASVSFAASARYKKEEKDSEKERTVSLEKVDICNYGTARYQSSLSADYQLTKGFLAAGCQLGTGKSDDSHMKFISQWGTHIITQAMLGTKKVNHTTTTIGEVVSFAMKDVGSAVKAGGSYAGTSGGLSVDASKFTQSDKFNEYNKGKSTFYERGTLQLPEPISITIEGIHSAFVPHFWKTSPCKPTDADLKKIQDNVKQALENYNIKLGVFPPPDDKKNLIFKLDWPKGVYVLPQAKEGCPEDSWVRGSRVQNTGSAGNQYPARNNWPVGTLTKYKITQSFCTKSNPKGTLFWPAGSYCIIKSKLPCPDGFQDGSLTWDDKGTANENQGLVGGEMPGGEFGKNTKIDYCCREDNLASNPVYLPTGKPFYLLAKSNNCQKVVGMDVTKEVITWDEESWFNQSAQSGSHPYDASTDAKGKDHKLTYCYYDTWP